MFVAFHFVIYIHVVQVCLPRRHMDIITLIIQNPLRHYHSFVSYRHTVPLIVVGGKILVPPGTTAVSAVHSACASSLTCH
jgi:hypothetical protein